jgi:hypothetical protein
METTAIKPLSAGNCRTMPEFNDDTISCLTRTGYLIAPKHFAVAKKPPL